LLRFSMWYWNNSSTLASSTSLNSTVLTKSVNCQSPLSHQSHGSQCLHQVKYFSKLHLQKNGTMVVKLNPLSQPNLYNRTSCQFHLTSRAFNSLGLFPSGS
jgi:hypothetical protein